jgi:uncharacterized caspase-like protein
MFPDHYAIVIGLSSYPQLGDPPPANLNGPEIDADAVAAWLTDPAAGGLPRQNVMLIRSRDCRSPPDPEPTRDRIEDAFMWLDKIALANDAAQKGRKVGTRLYFYCAGHGYSPDQRRGCLLAGNAEASRYTANISPSVWVEWLQDAEYFREYVLWMDCCMDRQRLAVPTAAPLAPIGSQGAPGPSFIAFAAPRPLKAVEQRIPEDGANWHGIFTWNLLQGLRGAATDPLTNTVTGRSLADWLRQAQLGWLEDADRRNPDVAKEPAIIDENSSLVFVSGVAPMEFDLNLRFPDTMTGLRARLWTGEPPDPGPDLAIAAGGTPVKLKPGLYLAEVPDTGLRHGFAVTRSSTIQLNENGDPPIKAAGWFTLTVNPNDPTAEIRLIGARFRPISNATGTFRSPLPFGLYQLRIASAGKSSKR